MLPATGSPRLYDGRGVALSTADRGRAGQGGSGGRGYVAEEPRQALWTAIFCQLGGCPVYRGATPHNSAPGVLGGARRAINV